MVGRLDGFHRAAQTELDEIAASHLEGVVGAVGGLRLGRPRVQVEPGRRSRSGKHRSDENFGFTMVRDGSIPGYQTSPDGSMVGSENYEDSLGVRGSEVAVCGSRSQVR